MTIIGHKEELLNNPRLTNIAKADTIRWYKKPNLRILYLTLLPCAIGVDMASGFDSSMMQGLQAVPAWDDYFDHPTGSRLGIYNAIYALGALMSVPFIPFISDRLGRRWTIILASVIMITGAAMQAGSRNYDMFMGARWLLGFGIPFAIVNALSLLGELSYAKERPIMTSLFSACWFAGAIIASGITYGTFAMDSTWSWRIPSLFQALPSICQIIFMPFCPESPRWLISKDRCDEAYAILKKYHSEGIDGEEFVHLEYAQIRTTIALEEENARSFAWADAWRDPAMRRRFLIAGACGFFTQWSGNGLLSFYLKKILEQIGITDPKTIQKILLSKTCWDLINCVPIALTAPRFPRRIGFLTCTIGVMLVYLVWTICSAQREQTGSDAAAVAVVVFVFLYSPCYNVGWNALTYTYLVEVFPFKQRAKGISFFQLTGRIAAFFNVFVNPIAMDAIQWKYYIFYCVWIVVEIATVYFLFPETYNRTLEELSFMFEGREKQERQERDVDKQMHHDEKEPEVVKGGVQVEEKKDLA